MPRLFVAVDAPENVRDQLVHLKREQDGVKWVPKHHLHFTLRFIGDVEDPRAITEALSAITFPSFDLKIQGVGQFPPKRAARVLWAGIQPVQEISALAKLVDGAVTGAGAAPDERPYSPHLTLARIKEAPASFARAFQAEHAALVGEVFRVDRFSLYSSVLESRGATHTLIAGFALK